MGRVFTKLATSVLNEYLPMGKFLAPWFPYCTYFCLDLALEVQIMNKISLAFIFHGSTSIKQRIPGLCDYYART